MDLEGVVLREHLDSLVQQLIVEDLLRDLKKNYGLESSLSEPYLIKKNPLGLLVILRLHCS